jgi:hypothetical protein
MKTACFEAVGCPGSSCTPIGMHFISSRAKRNPLVALLSTTSVVASRCGFAGLIAQHAQAIGIPHSLFGKAQRVPVRRSTPSGSDGR